MVSRMAIRVMLFGLLRAIGRLLSVVYGRFDKVGTIDVSVSLERIVDEILSFAKCKQW